MDQEKEEYNLLDEPWIRVMLPDATVKEVSLTDALLCAHQYKGLAGEMPTQDAAILRVLIAVLHAALTKEIGSNETTLESMDDALELWEELWAGKAFPQEPIKAYLEHWKDRFWLFHPDRPFWQAPMAAGKIYNVKSNGMVKPTERKAAKLNGEISESENKERVRLFANRGIEERQSLSYAEATRWLIYLNAYDDVGLKGRSTSEIKVSAGWLGQLGLIYLVGDNLFETLMLNFVLCNEEEVWESASPVWEQEELPKEDLVTVFPAMDQAALLTLQSRRSYLIREGKRVISCRVFDGDHFQPDQMSKYEMMTLWRRKEETILPLKHENAKFLWQDFSTLVGWKDTNGKKVMPGVVRWSLSLMLPEDYVIRYCCVGMRYDGKGCSTKDVFSDSLSMQANAFKAIGSEWRDRIEILVVSKCEKLAQCIWRLGAQLCSAGGGDSHSAVAAGNRAKGEFYFRVDVPFRNWLFTLDAQQSDTVLMNRIKEWNSTIRSIALLLGKELVKAAGPGAYSGRMCALYGGRQAKQKNEKKTLITAPVAYNRFKAGVTRVMEEG